VGVLRGDAAYKPTTVNIDTPISFVMYVIRLFYPSVRAPYFQPATSLIRGPFVNIFSRYIFFSLGSGVGSFVWRSEGGAWRVYFLLQCLSFSLLDGGACSNTRAFWGWGEEGSGIYSNRTGGGHFDFFLLDGCLYVL